MNGSLKRLYLTFAVLAAMTIGAAVPALATAPTLPVTGAELDAVIPVVLTTMGAIVLLATGGYFVFLIVRKGWKWMRGALG